MYLATSTHDPHALVWLLDEPLDLPVPAGLEWMSADELDGYYLLYRDPASTEPPARSRQ